MSSVVLVTGASNGMGKVFAERFAAQKRDLVIVARRDHELEALAERLEQRHGVRVHVMPTDLTAQEAATRLFQEVEARGLVVDGLINCAGFGLHGVFTTSDFGTLERMLQLNVMVLTQLTRLFAPGMRDRRAGFVLNVSSTMAFQPVPYFSAYAASKAYVLTFSEGLVEELRPYGVRVMVLCPGPTLTAFSDVANFHAPSRRYANWMTAEAVVNSALNALRRGETVHVPGALNAATARFVPLIPRSLVAKVAGRIMRPS